MGVIFRVNVVESDNLVKTIEGIKRHKYKVLVTSLNKDKNLYDVKLKKSAVVIGNEANGVSKEVLEKIDTHIKIPMLRKNRKFECVCGSFYNYVWICETK